MEKFHRDDKDQNLVNKRRTQGGVHRRLQLWVGFIS